MGCDINPGRFILILPKVASLIFHFSCLLTQCTTVYKKSFPKNARATFRRIKTNVPGKVRFDMGFDINPGTFVLILPKVVCLNFRLLSLLTLCTTIYKKYSRKTRPQFFEELRQTSLGKFDLTWVSIKILGRLS